MDISPSELKHPDFYHVLISAIAPRPIAWVSTLSTDGRPNLAPFSFFTVVSAQPPLLGFSPGPRRTKEGRVSKDTLRNVRDTGEFVVNVVTFEVGEAMNQTSGEYEHSVNEFELATLKQRPSQIVSPPQVAESPVSFECKLRQILDFGDPPTGSFVIGEIVSLHMDDGVLREGRLDGNALDLIGRLGGTQYSRTQPRFDMHRPKTE
jgi:flavin reductase (DIM6/NTAB) family NADH-FMN oxidoreductase RutF